jgi:hypothetical protein
VLWKTHSLIMRDVLMYFLLLFVQFYLFTRVGDCKNMYPYTVTDDRVGRNVKRKDNCKEFFRRDCVRKFSYYETVLCHLCSEDIQIPHTILCPEHYS